MGMQEKLQEEGASRGKAPGLSQMRMGGECAVARDRGQSQVHRTGPRTESSGAKYRGATERLVPEYCPCVLKGTKSEATCQQGEAAAPV